MRVITLLSLLVFCSCKIMKTKDSKDEDISMVRTETRAVTRAGDTVFYQVPNITFKDTTVYTYNRQGTTLKTVYDDKGDIARIECMASRIEELTRITEALTKSLSEKKKEKVEESKGINLNFIVLGVTVIAAVLLYKLL